MNKTYRLVWSHQQQKLVAVSECTRGRGKCGGKAPTLVAAAVAAAFSFGGAAQAACTAGPDTFTCSGAETSTRTLSGSPLNLTLDSTFSMNAAAGNGLTVTGTNGLSITQSASGGSLSAQGTVVDARNMGGSGTGVQVSLNGDIAGANGVIALNGGAGLTSIDVSGAISISGAGTFNRGVYSTTSVSSGNLSITTASIVGGGYGIWTFHQGTGSLIINTLGGAITGSDNTGIVAQNVTANTAAMTITTGDVSARQWGVWASHAGTGDLEVDTTAGNVTGAEIKGISAYLYMRNVTPQNLTITTRNVTGGQYGIFSDHDGLGSTFIDTTRGTVTTTIGSALYSAGILARNSVTSTDLTITTAAVTGAKTGIFAYNRGTGRTTIDTTGGTVAGASRDGIFAMNGSNATDLSITTATVTSSQYGVGARNYGTGSTVIDTTRGSVTASSGDGVSAFTSNTTANLTITTADVFGGTSGMVVYNFGNGSTSIDTTRGSVTGGYFQGINAQNDPSATDLTITTANVTGAQIGILARNNGTGATSITVAPGGVVQGGTAGISASHTSASPFAITINGEVRNASGLASALAITAASTGSGLTLQNNSNTIIGTVNLTAANDIFNNVGSWFTENGTSNFGAGSDTLNNSGFIRAANNAGLAETTRFNNLELFSHSGVVTLQDGAVGDRLITSGNFVGSNGEVRLDTVLDTGLGGSDVLEVNGDASGGARLRIVNAGGAGGQTTGDGIRVVQVNGTSTANAFSLAAPVKAGIWNYVLDFGGANNADQNWYLVSQGFNEVAAVYESTPRLLLDALQSIPTLQQRVGQRQVYGQSGEQGAWVRVVGEWRDATARNSSAGSRWDSQTRSLQGGYDHVLTETAKGDLAFGLTGHYQQLDANIRNAGGNGKLDGESYGGGLTLTWYGKQGSYVDLQAVASRNALDFSSASLGALAKDRHGSAVTLSAEAGHRLILDERQTLIPQLQWQVTRLRQDDITDQQGNRVTFGKHTSHLARLGLAWEYRSDRKDRFYLIGNLLHDFTPMTDVSINGTRFQAENFRNAAELGFGGTVGLNSSVVIYGEGNYRRSLGGGDNSDGYLLTAGLRLSW